MANQLAAILKWLRRPQFTTRTFLLTVTFICGPLAWIGGEIYRIKNRATAYRAAINNLQASGIIVSRIRDRDVATQWETFAQNWIDNDAYAGEAVEVQIGIADLKPSDFKSLRTFAKFRSINLASPALTDKTLLELEHLGPVSALTISNGDYSPTALTAISKLNLTALDLTGIQLDEADLTALTPALKVDELALSLNNCSPKAIQLAFAGRTYKRLYLENAGLQAFLRNANGSPLYENPLDHPNYKAMSLSADLLPGCEHLILKGMSLDDQTIKQLGLRQELKMISLWQCDADATLLLSSFRTVLSGGGSNVPPNRPALQLDGVLTAKSEIGPEEIELLKYHHSISRLTIRKWKSPHEVAQLLEKNLKLTDLTLPTDVPPPDLIRLIKSDHKNRRISLQLTDEELNGLSEANRAKVIANGGYVSLDSYLVKHGVDFMSILREMDQTLAAKPPK